MSFVRPIVIEGGLQQPARTGACASAGPLALNTVAVATTLTATLISSGALLLNTGATVTADTAANYLLAYPELQINDSISFYATNNTAGVITPTAATGVTIGGRGTFAIGLNLVILTRTGASAYTLAVI